MSLAHVSSPDNTISYRRVALNIPPTAPCTKATAIKPKIGTSLVGLLSHGVGVNRAELFRLTQPGSRHLSWEIRIDGERKVEAWSLDHGTLGINRTAEIDVGSPKNQLFVASGPRKFEMFTIGSAFRKHRTALSFITPLVDRSFTQTGRTLAR
jgi:hypothetical protein